MYDCKRKMAIAATQIAASYTSNSEVELPLTLMKRAETLSDSGDHKMYLFEQVGALRSATKLLLLSFLCFLWFF